MWVRTDYEAKDCFLEIANSGEIYLDLTLANFKCCKMNQQRLRKCILWNIVQYLVERARTFEKL